MKYKNYLQTAAILCAENEKRNIANQLIAAGVVRSTTGENMSKQYSGAAHDGEQALKRYTRLVSIEQLEKGKKNF